MLFQFMYTIQKSFLHYGSSAGFIWFWLIADQMTIHILANIASSIELLKQFGDQQSNDSLIRLSQISQHLHLFSSSRPASPNEPASTLFAHIDIARASVDRFLGGDIPNEYSNLVKFLESFVPCINEYISRIRQPTLSSPHHDTNDQSITTQLSSASSQSHLHSPNPPLNTTNSHESNPETTEIEEKEEDILTYLNEQKKLKRKKKSTEHGQANDNQAKPKKHKKPKTDKEKEQAKNSNKAFRAKVTFIFFE